MSLGKLGTLAAAGSIVASGVFAQENELDGRTDHFDTELGLMEYNACKVGKIIGRRDTCVEFGYNAYDEEGKRERHSFFTKDGESVNITYDEYLGLRQLGNFEYIKPDDGSNSHILINEQTGEKIEIPLNEGDRIEEVLGNHALIRDKSYGRKVINLEGKEVFSSKEIFMRGEEGFKKINIGELDDEQFDMLVGMIAYQNSIRMVDVSDINIQEAGEVFYNTTDKNSMIRLMWENRDAILAKSDYFSQYIEPLVFVKNNFEAVETIIGKLEGRSLLEADNVGYNQDFRSEYFEAFSEIPGLLEAFGYQKPAEISSNDSIFGESDSSTTINSNDEYQEFQVIRNVQFLYRRLENPITHQMIEWFLQKTNNSFTQNQESE